MSEAIFNHLFRIAGVNDVKNLVPACSGCNRKKGAKLGRWITKARLGKHRSYWIARNVGRVTTLVVIFLGGVLLCQSKVNPFEIAAEMISVLITVVGRMIAI